MNNLVIFDERGLLMPPDVNVMSVSAFDEAFVRSFATSETRQLIFEEYLSFTERFRQEVCSTFRHWIDGSFVTDKLNPNDLDVVVLINDIDYKAKEILIELDFRLAGAKRHFPNLDIYALRNYRVGDGKRYITEFDLAYWHNWFTRTRPNRVGKQFRKGFVQIDFDF